jgi:hypothetical protein
LQVVVRISADISKSFSYSLMDGSLVSPSAAAAVLDASSAVVVPCQSDILALFQRLLPLDIFWAAALRQAKVRENNRVYSSSVVVG